MSQTEVTKIETADAAVTAAILVIGDEILSGRTKDKNIGYIAEYLTNIGIDLREVRVVPDVEEEIVAAVNALRSRYTHVFTTGGIGPTHDDLTVVIGGWPIAEFEANRTDIEGNFLKMLQLAPAFADRVGGATRQTRFVGPADVAPDGGVGDDEHGEVSVLAVLVRAELDLGGRARLDVDSETDEPALASVPRDGCLTHLTATAGGPTRMRRRERRACRAGPSRYPSPRSLRSPG